MLLYGQAVLFGACSFIRSSPPLPIHTAWCLLIVRQEDQVKRYGNVLLHGQAVLFDGRHPVGNLLVVKINLLRFAQVFVPKYSARTHVRSRTFVMFFMARDPVKP